MLRQNILLARFTALVAAAVCCASTTTASVQFNVGKYKLNESPVPFVASWLHDASSSPSAGASVFGPEDNRAFRTGNTSSALGGSFEGDFDSTGNVVTNIRGTLSGTTKMLLNSFDSSNNFQSFILKLGQDAGAGKSGKLAFETVGTREYTGGYIDYAIAVAINGVDYVDVLTGTFFFKPQGENSNSLLSPNRGTVSEFMLWGYNYMHDSYAYSGATADWASFFSTLGYTNNVTRPAIVGDSGSTAPPTNQTLGVSLYVTSGIPGSSGNNPEPTALIIWAMLTMVGACLSGRVR